MERTQYFVTEENTLAYLPDGSLSCGEWIMPFALASKGMYGHDWKSGMYCVHKGQSRPATMEDFEVYRVQPPKGIIFGTGETYVNH